VVHHLERLELTELLSQYCRVVPDDIYVGMPGNLLFLSLFDCLRLNLLHGHMLLARIFLRSGGLLFARAHIIIIIITITNVIVVVSISALLRSYDFPFHFQGALSEQLIPSIGQIYSYFSSIKYVEICGATGCCRSGACRCICSSGGDSSRLGFVGGSSSSILPILSLFKS